MRTILPIGRAWLEGFAICLVVAFVATDLLWENAWLAD